MTRLTVATQQTFLQVSKLGYANLINGHASLQSRTGKWRNNELLKTWLTCKKSFLGGHGKARRTVSWVTDKHATFG